MSAALPALPPPVGRAPPLGALAAAGLHQPMRTWPGGVPGGRPTLLSNHSPFSRRRTGTRRPIKDEPCLACHGQRIAGFGRPVRRDSPLRSLYCIGVRAARAGLDRRRPERHPAALPLSSNHRSPKNRTRLPCAGRRLRSARTAASSHFEESLFMAKTPLRLLAAFIVVAAMAFGPSTPAQLRTPARFAVRSSGPTASRLLRFCHLAQRHFGVQCRDDDRPRRQLPVLQRSVQSLRAAHRHPGVRGRAHARGRAQHDSREPRVKLDLPAVSESVSVMAEPTAAARDRQHDVAHRHRQVLIARAPAAVPMRAMEEIVTSTPGFRAWTRTAAPLSGRAQPERIRHRRPDDRGPDGRDLLELDRSRHRAVARGHLRQRPGRVRREGRRRDQHVHEVGPRRPL